VTIIMFKVIVVVKRDTNNIVQIYGPYATRARAESAKKGIDTRYPVKTHTFAIRTLIEMKGRTSPIVGISAGNN
jgi:hypothetical protein